MKKKRRGQVRKEISKEDMLYSLKLCGKKDRRYIFALILCKIYKQFCRGRLYVLLSKHTYVLL